MGGDLFFRFFAKLVRMNGCRINAVWPDLVKFCHYGNILLVNLVLDKILNLLWQNFESILAKFWHKFKAIALNFLVVNGQTLKIYLAIWSLWINETKRNSAPEKVKQILPEKKFLELSKDFRDDIKKFTNVKYLLTFHDVGW